ncbi:MAG: hypothetical protein ACXVQJ_03195 [Actinomycetota bacterium]
MRVIGTGATVHAADKPGGGLRWMTTLSPADHRAYARLVGHVAPGPRARGSADRAPVGPAGADLVAARLAWRAEVRARASTLRVPILVRSDVRSCYPSIGPQAVGRGLARLGAAQGQIHTVLAFVRAVQAQSTPGLPIGPQPSARLADAVLSVADEAVVSAGAWIVRWVDDVVLIAEGRRAAGRAFDAWAAALAELGLRPHEGKTRTAPGDDTSASAIGAGASAAHRGAHGRIGPL